ncbi:hypothetical protein LINPERPRIM_LOCUS30465 [Linum perenne]
MSRKLPQLWARKGLVKVSDVGFGFYIVKFETMVDFERAMFGGPWMINDHYVVIQEWRPHFRLEATVVFGSVSRAFLSNILMLTFSR